MQAVAREGIITEPLEGGCLRRGPVARVPDNAAKEP